MEWVDGQLVFEARDQFGVAAEQQSCFEVTLGGDRTHRAEAVDLVVGEALMAEVGKGWATGRWRLSDLVQPLPGRPP
nr:hypothetical protein [Williamsia soli]